MTQEHAVEPILQNKMVEQPQSKVPLRSPQDINLERFNRLVGDWKGKPVDDMKRLFIKQVILDDETTLDVETIKVPGFIGISDAFIVENPQGERVSGHQDVVDFLERDGLLICTYQWHKERYGIAVDTRRSLDPETLIETLIKNEGHHASVLVPALRLRQGELVSSYAALNEPDGYHQGMYGADGYVAVAQRLCFSEGVSPEQARGYINTIICWMTLLNPFVQFPDHYTGSDPTHITDRNALETFLQQGLLASLGDASAIAFFQNPANRCYCSEFIFVCLNTPLYPFNLSGLTELLGDSEKAKQVLAIQTRQNARQTNPLSQKTNNPEFQAFNIPMPVVPADLPPLDSLLLQPKQTIDSQQLPFPPFSLSQVIRRAFHQLLPRHQGDAILQQKVAQAQARVFQLIEPALMQQLGLSQLPESDAKVAAVRQFLSPIAQELDQLTSADIFEQKIDALLQKVDEMLIGIGDRNRFVPPRIYVDLGQNDGDEKLPKGWGLHLETVGALVARQVMNH